jgi:hypothetical protein
MEQQGRVCIKLVEGWAGEGFEVIDLIREDGTVKVRCHSDRSTVNLHTFCQRLSGVPYARGALIEAYLEQHPELSAFNASSVNTCRIWVIQPVNAPARAVLAYLRIGRGGSLVDNQSRGGIVAPIDLGTGITGCAVDGLPERESFPIHPDHGATIEGKQLPFWEESIRLAEDCLGAFPGFRFGGLDIAITDQGPVILEINPSPDREGATFADVPTKRIFST